MKKLSDIQTLIETFLGALAINATISQIEKDNHLLFSVKTDTPEVLIDNDGEVLQALNHLAKRAFEKTLSEEYKSVSVDVNEFIEGRHQSLVRGAELVAKDVVSSQKEASLQPMNAYERMLVHTTLKQLPGIRTGSQGEGIFRHIVIYPES